jgi:NADH:ubiquinone oxidoreductase subunit F (NADH-binding)
MPVLHTTTEFYKSDPHRFLEGMLIAALCVGCDEIYIYLRDEYAGCGIPRLPSIDSTIADSSPQI